MRRPDWIDAIAAVWGEPGINQSAPQAARLNNLGRRELRFVRMWMWESPDGGAWGVRLWNTSPRLKDCLIACEVRGPAGAANYSRPGDQMPLGAIVSLLELAGIPPYAGESGADLTTRQDVNYAQDSATTPDEENSVNDSTEPREGIEVENLQGESAEQPAATTEDAAATDGAEDVDTTGRDEHDSNRTDSIL